MAIPRSIREQMAKEGHTVEDIANEIDGQGDFGLNAAINGNSESVQEPAPVQQVQEPAPVQQVQEPAPVQQVQEPASAQEPRAVALDPVSVNPFDIDFDDPSPAPIQQAPAPVQQAPAPVQQAPAPVQQAPAPVQQAPAKRVKLAPVELTPEEIAMFGGAEQANTFKAIIDRYRAADAESVQSVSDQLAADQLNNNRRAFRSGIASSVPDHDAIIHSKRWQHYLNEYSPMAGGTIGSALLAADARFDRKAVIGIFEDFRAKFGGKAPTNKAENLAVPGRMAAAPVGQQPSRRFAFNESYAQELVEKRRTRQITSSQFHESMEKYEEALTKGLVQLGV